MKRISTTSIALIVIGIILLGIALLQGGCVGEFVTDADEWAEGKITPVNSKNFHMNRGNVERLVDEGAGVVCWIFTRSASSVGSIDCIPIGQTRLK